MSDNFYSWMNQSKYFKVSHFPAQVYKITPRFTDEEGNKEDWFELYVLKIDCFVNGKFDRSELVFLEPSGNHAEISIAIPNALNNCESEEHK